MIALLLSLKTLELRARRDAFVVFFLGFFVVLTNFLYSQKMMVAAAMLIGLWGLLTALVNAHRPVGNPRLRESARTALFLTLAGAPIMALLFMFFPRLPPLWGMPAELMGRTGLSSTMNLGAINKLALDDGIALRVKFQGRPPPQGQLYFRGPVLSDFDGSIWTSGEEQSFESKGPRDLQTSGDPTSYEITLEPSQQPWLLAIDATPNSLQIDSGGDRQRVRLNRDLQWLTSRPITDLLRYRGVSYLSFRYGQDEWDERGTQYMTRFLRLPAGRDPRTGELADQLRAQAHDDSQTIVNLALQRLRTGGYRYTLEPGPTAFDSADQFWFDSKIGFCEHISSAFVILMRAAGVPARVVTGFQGGELNGIDDYWVVRNADAHAWAEVWLEQRGWVRVDPTGAVWPARVSMLQNSWQRLTRPEGFAVRTVDAISPQLLGQLRAFWDAANNRWNQWVLNYTQTRQLDLLRSIGFSAPQMIDLAKILIGVLVVALLFGIAWAMWERSEHDPWLRLLTRARTRLERMGVTMPPGAAVTPRALIRQVQASSLPKEWCEMVTHWLLQLERWRYCAAGDATGAGSLTDLRKQWRNIDRTGQRAIS
jgi:transglutaminase-like putative cysteine protease